MKIKLVIKNWDSGRYYVGSFCSWPKDLGQAKHFNTTEEIAETLQNNKEDFEHVTFLIVETIITLD